MLIVLKFGGSSLAGPEAVGRSAEIIAREARLTLDEIQSVDYSWQQMQIYSQPITLYGAGMTEKRLANIDSMDIDIEAADINIEDTVTIVWAVE